MGMFNSIMISASGLTAEQLRMDVISNNIANVNTTRTAKGGAYRRQQVVFASRDKQIFMDVLKAKMPRFGGRGVKIVGIKEDPSPLKTVYDPNHPDANKEGFVELPNVNIVKEMVDMIAASRAYEANVTALNAAKTMAVRALSIGRG